jgi:hypothetical protein
MYQDILKSRKSKKGAGSSAAMAAKAPAGYSLAPGSKKGRYRKKVGGKWQYYDPNKVSTKTHAAKVAELATAAKGAPKALGDMLHAAALGDFARASALGHAYKAHHHKIDELVELLHVAEVAAHQPIHIAAHAIAAAAGGAGHIVQQFAGTFAMGGADDVADPLAKATGENEDDEDKEEEAREKKIAQENGEDEEDDDEGDEDAAEDRKEQARDSFNASMSFGAVIHKAGAMQHVARDADGSFRYRPDARIADARADAAELRHKAAVFGQLALDADARRGKPGWLEKFTGNGPTAEMAGHAAEHAEATAGAEAIEEADKHYRASAGVGGAMLDRLVPPRG